MSSPTLRRSSRWIPDFNECCSKCAKNYRFSPQDDSGQYRCPDCFHYNDAEYVWRVHGESVRSNTNIFCLCLCECIDTDDPNDADVEMSSDTEPEDDETTRISRPIEALVTSRYGWRTNVILDQNTEHERVILEESIGHFAAASSHDTAIPAESSLANGSNRIGVTEVHDLQEPLQPWEAANMVRGDTTRTWQDLEQIFPEMSRMGRNEPGPPLPASGFCQFCHRPFSEGWHQWLASGTMMVCPNCRICERPADPEDDPDWNEINIGDPDAVDHCLCRCECQTRSSQSSGGDIAMGQDASTSAYNPNVPSWHTGRRSPMVLPSLAFVGRHMFVREDETHDEFTDYIRVAFSLRSLELSTDPDEDVAMQENVALALEQCESAIEQEEYEQAVRYAQLGLQIGRYMLNMSHRHRLMHALLEATERLAELGADIWDVRVYRRSVDSLTEEWSPPQSLEDENNPWPATGQENL